MKKGACVEIYQAVNAGTVDPERKVLVPIADREEYCRDRDDVIGVLMEKNLIGVFLCFRRAGSPIGRVPQTVMQIVTPKSDPVYEEVSDANKPEADPIGENT